MNPQGLDTLLTPFRNFSEHSLTELETSAMPKSHFIQNFVENDLQKPLLHNDTDYSESDTEQHRTDIEAFIELI